MSATHRTFAAAVSAVVSAAALALAAAPASAQLLYQTGFETPDFAVGPINGQSGWANLYDAIDPAGAYVVTEQPQSGSQALRLDYVDAEVIFPGLRFIDVYRDETIDNGTARTLEAQVSVRVDVPGDVPDPDPFFSAGIAFYDEPTGLPVGIVQQGSNGVVYASAFNELNEVSFVGSTPSTIDAYHAFGLRVDATARVVTYLLDGRPFATAPLPASVGALLVYYPDLFVVGPDDPALDGHTATFDDLSVSIVVPEPAGAAALALAAGGLARRRCHA